MENVANKIAKTKISRIERCKLLFIAFKNQTIYPKMLKEIFSISKERITQHYNLSQTHQFVSSIYDKTIEEAGFNVVSLRKKDQIKRYVFVRILQTMQDHKVTTIKNNPDGGLYNDDVSLVARCMQLRDQLYNSSIEDSVHIINQIDIIQASLIHNIKLLTEILYHDNQSDQNDLSYIIDTIRADAIIISFDLG